MYVLVRDDLPPGSQLAQSIHAAVELTLRQPDVAVATPTVVVLAVPDERELVGHAGAGVLFTEPDLGDEATAYAEFGDGRRFSNLPLAGASMMT